jgi:serine/threonine-protein kinase
MKICPVCSTEYPDDVRFCPNDGQTLRSTAPGGANDLVGQIIADRYHVVKKLGEGGMGQVYLAEHVKMGRRSAIKVMNPSMVHDPDAVARFNREASNASRINHPNVCAIYDFGETPPPDGLIYLAMEFIEGEPLTDLLERNGALPLQQAVGIFLQTADALQAAHDLGIVHRDLKPDNIMLTRRKGGGEMVKVVDFGIAKAVSGDQSGQKVTKTGLVVGTPEFMSPEQLSGDLVDGRSDLYSLALVFYRMLTGKLPFEATSVQETMIKRLTDEPKTLADERPDLSFPPGLQPVLDTALARTPAERYQSVAKFAADIAAVTGMQTVAPVPHTRSSADSESKTQLLDTAQDATQRVSAKRLAHPKKSPLVPVMVGVVVLLAAGGAWVVLNGGNKAAGNPPPADTTRHAQTAPPPANRETQRPPGGARRVIDPRRAGDSLNTLFDRIDQLSGTMLRDAALDIFNTDGVTNKDKALAAYLAANGWAKLDDSSNTCAWARRAENLDRSSRAYVALRQSTCGS